jgi:hypothetical protein
MRHELKLLVFVLGLAGLCSANAEVSRSEFGEDDIQVYVSGEDWHPKGFEHGTSVPATYQETVNITLDGKDTEPEWEAANEVLVPLEYGAVNEALVKVLYTDEKIYFRVRWPDDTEDREHHPWTWDSGQQQYVAGQQVEDSIMLSFEAGCNWRPSLLGGDQYDFDGWHWLAARSDPVGQAWDLAGNVADQGHARLKPVLHVPSCTPYKLVQNRTRWYACDSSRRTVACAAKLAGQISSEQAVPAVPARQAGRRCGRDCRKGALAGRFLDRGIQQGFDDAGKNGDGH